MRSPVPSSPAIKEEEFLRAVRSELHALAQPLTLLQVRVEAAMLCGANAALEPLLSALDGDVRRACTHFSALQDLVKKRSEAHPSRACFSGQDLLRSVLNALSPCSDGRLGEHGAKLRLAMPKLPVWVLADEQNVRCSLLQAALLLRGVLPASDVLTLSLAETDACALVQLTAPASLNLDMDVQPAFADVITGSLEALGFIVAQDACLKSTLRLPLGPASGAKLPQ